jgi:hypothetical protein
MVRRARAGLSLKFSTRQEQPTHGETLLKRIVRARYTLGQSWQPSQILG